MTAKAYRLLCSILMTAVTSERPTRSAAEAALWAMGKNGRADYDHDRRYRPLMLLAKGTLTTRQIRSRPANRGGTDMRHGL